ncbi:hypothetical protein SS50377_28403 [Spironucleus salmonicida]|uniref:Uncharacterized protein n=1 Tax=Spironucleus salmonicida TaxID=348837 RepID=V6LFY4_9EUKA|nr:hypothetical protein SS50377_28403 [Spironucleus salmonicida]|eukprot:EST43178.1 Hypothetical protein SS50377_17119 [Spironucleus salmonicida]
MPITQSSSSLKNDITVANHPGLKRSLSKMGSNSSFGNFGVKPSLSFQKEKLLQVKDEEPNLIPLQEKSAFFIPDVEVSNSIQSTLSQEVDNEGYFNGNNVVRSSKNSLCENNSNIASPIFERTIEPLEMTMESQNFEIPVIKLSVDPPPSLPRFQPRPQEQQIVQRPINDFNQDVQQLDQIDNSQFLFNNANEQQIDFNLIDQKLNHAYEDINPQVEDEQEQSIAQITNLEFTNSLADFQDVVVTAFAKLKGKVNVHDRNSQMLFTQSSSVLEEIFILQNNISEFIQTQRQKKLNRRLTYLQFEHQFLNEKIAIIEQVLIGSGILKSNMINLLYQENVMWQIDDYEDQSLSIAQEDTEHTQKGEFFVDSDIELDEVDDLIKKMAQRAK